MLVFHDKSLQGPVSQSASLTYFLPPLFLVQNLKGIEPATNMASDAVKKVQEKLFGKATSSLPFPTLDSTRANGTADGNGINVLPRNGALYGLPKMNASQQERPELPGLTIDIPKPLPTPMPPPKMGKSVESPLQNPESTGDETLKTYRERLIESLGSKYQGVERYRLQQDGKKERHWKRWGPYLSDRQWVRDAHYWVDKH